VPGYSKIGCEYMDMLMKKCGVIIMHAHYDKETKKITGSEHYVSGVGKVDGYITESNTVIEFHGDYWHGNPAIYDQKEMCPGKGYTFGDLLEATRLRMKVLREEGYTVYYVWEKDFKEWKMKKEPLDSLPITLFT
jgi:G:T-mismatch repair DNA endonuclease (very short patch repair protein)